MSIFANMQAAWKQARLTRDSASTATLSTFLEGMRMSIMGDLSPSMYGIYKPKDAEVIRYLKNAIKTADNGIELAKKQDTDSSVAFVLKTMEEVLLLESFLPRQLTDEELRVAITHAVGDSELTGGKLMGYVMSELKRQYEGLFDASKVKGLLLRE